MKYNVIIGPTVWAFARTVGSFLILKGFNMTLNNTIKSEYSAVILAGGKSSRMGDNKAFLKWNGSTFLQHSVFKMKQIGIETIIVSGRYAHQTDVKFVEDVYPDRGPLGGMHACMKQANTQYCFVIPVDAPNIPLFVMEELISYHQQLISENPDRNPVVLWEHGDRIEPLIGIYPVEIADGIGELIDAGPAPVFRMLDRWEYICHRIEISKDMIVNINTRENYKELKKIINE